MGLQIDEAALKAKAVELGVIKDGEALPRHERSRVAAALIAGDQQRPAVPEPVCAKEIVVQPGGAITVDGEPFPWLVARTPMEIGLNPEGISTVRLTLLAESVQVLKPKPNSTSESE